jgi:hypothetical protein
MGSLIMLLLSIFCLIMISDIHLDQPAAVSCHYADQGVMYLYRATSSTMHQQVLTIIGINIK